MTETFGAQYATAYDTFYESKDYNQECEMLSDIFAEFADQPVQSILDLGCGTGNHAFPLAQKGFKVVGVDRSSSMLEAARSKIEEYPALQTQPEFYVQDIRKLDSDQKFDAVILMFNVLGYLLEDEDIDQTLKGIRRHLSPGGLFVCDFWYGPSVVRSPPEERKRTFKTDSAHIVRHSIPTTDKSKNICRIDMTLEFFEKGVSMNTEEERHEVRFFFPEEISAFFSRNGLELKHIGGFPDFKSDPDETGSWGVTAIAQAMA